MIFNCFNGLTSMLFLIIIPDIKQENSMDSSAYLFSPIPYETYLYGTKFGDFWKKSPYFRTSKIVTAISISHTLIFM